MTELTLEENIRKILPTLPPPIQRFFEQGKLGATAKFLMERYALHIDQGTILERELMFLLLGLEDANKFAAELYANLPISRQTVSDIITDINQEVFVPIQKQMMEESKTVRPAPQSAAPVRPPQPQVRPTAPPVPHVNAPISNYKPPHPPAVEAKPRQFQPTPASVTKPGFSLHDVVQQVTAHPSAPALEAKPREVRGDATSAQPARPDHLLPVGEEESHVAPLPPKMAMPRGGQSFGNRVVPLATPSRPGHPVNLLNPQSGKNPLPRNISGMYTSNSSFSPPSPTVQATVPPPVSSAPINPPPPLQSSSPTALPVPTETGVPALPPKPRPGDPYREPIE